MAFVDEEIVTQPANWAEAVVLAGKEAQKLPAPGQRVAFVGCGTSWFMSMAAAGLREAAGLGESDAFTASEFPHHRRYDRVIAITRSGTTTEVIELLSKLKSPSTVITAVPDSPVVPLANEAIFLDFADESSVLQTRFATTVLALLRAHFGEDLTQAIEDAKTALAAPIDELAKSEQISFLGTGWTIGLAQEGALKTRESAQFWAEAYPAMDYRHGPISIAQPGRTTWCFGQPPRGLADDVAATGARFETSTLDPMAHLIVAQRVAVAIAKGRGLDPDHPRALARSIILQ